MVAQSNYENIYEDLGNWLEAMYEECKVRLLNDQDFVQNMYELKQDLDQRVAEGQVQATLSLTEEEFLEIMWETLRDVYRETYQQGYQVLSHDMTEAN